MTLSHSALLLFYLLLIVAALQDMRRLQISNMLSLSIIAAFFLHVALNGATWHLWQNLVSFTVLLFVGGLLFDRKLVGGGDAKLLTAAALWFDIPGLAIWLPAVAVIGGLTALLLLLIRGLIPARAVADGGWIGLQGRGSIPYAVPICIAAIATAHLAGVSPPAG